MSTTTKSSFANSKSSTINTTISSRKRASADSSSISQWMVENQQSKAKQTSVLGDTSNIVVSSSVDEQQSMCKRFDSTNNRQNASDTVLSSNATQQRQQTQLHAQHNRQRRTSGSGQQRQLDSFVTSHRRITLEPIPSGRRSPIRSRIDDADVHFDEEIDVDKTVAAAERDVDVERVEEPKQQQQSSKTVQFRGLLARYSVSSNFALPPGIDLDELESNAVDSDENEQQSQSTMPLNASMYVTPSKSTTNLNNNSNKLDENRMTLDEYQTLFDDSTDRDESIDNESSTTTTTKIVEPTRESSLQLWRTEQALSFSMDDLRRNLTKNVDESGSKCDNNRSTTCYRAQHFDPTERANAESELDRYLRKSDFARMIIIGQFNNGFIIVRLDDELFIIDQHAADEKYQFERMQRDVRIPIQSLIHPETLQLGAVQEQILVDSMAIFNKSGFDFIIDSKAAIGRRVRMTGIPDLNNWQFDKNDIDEMLGVLVDFPGTLYRPTKIRNLFASRACRQSTMIGTALTVQQMTSIVTNLGELDHPWNCPHGRPTLRHLATVNECVLECEQ